MPFEKVGNGYIAKNDNPQGNQPPYRGKIFLKNEDGSENKLDLGAWVKEKNGKNMFSISVSREIEEEQSKNTAAPQEADDEIPF